MAPPSSRTRPGAKRWPVAVSTVPPVMAMSRAFGLRAAAARSAAASRRVGMSAAGSCQAPVTSSSRAEDFAVAGGRAAPPHEEIRAAAAAAARTRRIPDLYQSALPRERKTPLAGDASARGPGGELRDLGGIERAVVDAHVVEGAVEVVDQAAVVVDPDVDDGGVLVVHDRGKTGPDDLAIDVEAGHVVVP